MYPTMMYDLVRRQRVLTSLQPESEHFVVVAPQADDLTLNEQVKDFGWGRSDPDRVAEMHDRVTRLVVQRIEYSSRSRQVRVGVRNHPDSLHACSLGSADPYARVSSCGS